jgi:hypothetical protein
VPVFFRTGSALGIHPSECSPLERYPRYYRPDDPTYRFTCRCSRRRNGGPAQQASVPGIQPFRESLAIGRVFSSPNAGYSPGFRPSRVSHHKPCPGLHRNSSLALLRAERIIARSPAPRSISRLATGLISLQHLTALQMDQTTLRGFLHRLDPIC